MTLVAVRPVADSSLRRGEFPTRRRPVTQQASTGSSLRFVGVRPFRLATVEVAEELRIVVGGDRSPGALSLMGEGRKGASRRTPERVAARFDRAHDEVDHQGDDRYEKQEFPHVPSVEGRETARRRIFRSGRVESVP